MSAFWSWTSLSLASRCFSVWSRYCFIVSRFIFRPAEAVAICAFFAAAMGNQQAGPYGGAASPRLHVRRTAVLRPRQSIEANPNLRQLLAAPLVQIQKLRTANSFARWKRRSRITRKLRRGGQRHEH